MSKTYGNHIGINEPPNEIFGKVMSISDAMMLRYYELLTLEDLEKVKAGSPRDAKAGLAAKIVEKFHGREAAIKANEEFERVFVKKDVPADIGRFVVSEKKPFVVDLLVLSGLVSSKNEARRAISQGALKIDDARVTDDKLQLEMNREYVFKLGKRKFMKFTGNNT